MNRADKDRETWFYRGREACGQGRPRELPNGQVSLHNRQHWYDGWDEEKRIRAPKPSSEQIQEFNQFLADLAAEVRASK